MDIETFVNAVIEMRRKQKRYFRTRLQGDLIASKRAEAIVDKLLAESVAPHALQLDLDPS